MAEELLLTLKLLFIKDIQKGAAATTILFEDGHKAKLANDHKDYDYFLRVAQRSQARNYPVGVSLAKPDRLVELARADNDFLKEILEQDKEKLKVEFQGHDGFFFLRRDHAEFKRLQEVLQKALQDKSRIWFVATKPTLVIRDVLLVDPKLEKK